MVVSQCLNSYKFLKEIIIKETPNCLGILNELKYTFREDIDSVRRLDCIHNIPELIEVLEYFDILSEYNIEPLKRIAYYCENNTPGSQSINIAFANYITPPNNGPVNVYRDMRLADNLQSNSHINNKQSGKRNNVTCSPSSTYHPPETSSVNGCNGSSLYPAQLTDKKRSAIHKKVAMELGSYWRRFGRELGISEGQMDQIEVEFPRDLVSRVYRLFKTFEEDECHDPKQYVLLICRALEDCQRKDLRRLVENIMSH